MNNLLDEKCIKLGFGLMRLPQTADKQIDVEHTKKMVDAFIQGGGKYFDTAFIYGGSEPATKLALVDRYPRESYYLASKLNAAEFACKSKEEALNEINITLERTGAGYLDFYLLHGIEESNKDKYDEYGLWDYVKQLKEEGKIKHYGFSFHDSPELLDKLLTDHPDAEFVQLQINYADWEDRNVQSRGIYEVAVKHEKPIIVMEPVKGGLLANVPDVVDKVLKEADKDASAASWAIRYVASLPGVMVVLSGMSNLQQMEDNLSFMSDFKPFTQQDFDTIQKARIALDGVERIPCTGCSYCTPGCPQGILMPQLFKVLNIERQYGDLARAKNDYQWIHGSGKAGDCLQCGQCEEACPQHLPIIDLLQEVAEKLEK